MDVISEPEKKSLSMMQGMKWWQRLQQEMDRLGWNKKELSERSGVPYDSVNKYLRGDTEQPRGDSLPRLAQAIGKPLVWLRDGLDPDQGELRADNQRLQPVAKGGTVEAGAFREVEDMDQSEPEFIYEAPDQQFPNARRMTFDVAGNSMDDLKPRPILPGDRVICVAYEDVSHLVPLRDGMVVVVERTRDGGLFREWSVKQIEIQEGRTVFHPRSTSPRYKPIVVEQDTSADAGVQVEVIGLVRRITTEVPVF